ncbi:MAG: DUF1080 domain-containing protein [Limisphaera sp.]|nr:DUF1080 domain-containing protein [Limisphaera sp.]
MHKKSPRVGRWGWLALGIGALCVCSCTGPRVEPGFEALFDGRSLDGWQHVGGPPDGYVVQDGILHCTPRGQNLFTTRQFLDFILRFDFRLEEGSNNGVGIRAPLEGDAAYAGMEIQILEETAALKGKWGRLRPEQFHGSIYDVAAARRGALRPPGQWNTEEILADGRHIRVRVNGQTVLDVNLNEVHDLDVLRRHPGLFREQGHIGFLGHGDPVQFRNIRIKELRRSESRARDGFRPLFNGRDLTGWKGWVDPREWARMTETERAAARARADALMRENWRVEDGALVYRGKGFDNLCTEQEFRNFEFVCEWKIAPQSDSGIYLRGVPQVQIWDPFTPPVGGGREVGSGGLYNNQQHPSRPRLRADRPVGQWNRFRIVMMGDRVHVFLNDQLVVENTPLENYWERGKPLPPAGPIELQAHGTPVWFRDLWVRELPD